jgi:hypothetical protein
MSTASTLLDRTEVAAFHAAKVVEAGWVADLAVALADCEVVLADRNNSTNRVWTALTTRSAWLEARIIAIQASPESRSDRREIAALRSITHSGRHFLT